MAFKDHLAKQTFLNLFIAILAVGIGITSCAPGPISVPVDQRIGALPEFVIDPVDNPSTSEKVELGKLLFWDPILSGNFDVACATCHHPDKGWADNLTTSLGVGGVGLGENRFGGEVIKRNAPTIINTAFNGIDVDGNYDPSETAMFWDNRSNSLEAQALEPIKSGDEMRGDVYSADDAISVVSERLANIPEYVTLFNNAFGPGTTIDGDKIGKAIAAYERSIIANNSRFDQYARGDDEALDVQEIRGLNAFIEMNCTACHSGPMFSDYELHNLGVPQGMIEDEGVDGKFRTPTLRNLSETGPFMHNGNFSNLNAAVNFYNNFNQSEEAAQQVDFDDDPETVNAVVAFLRTLNDPNFDRSVPESVPSGHPVGGNID